MINCPKCQVPNPDNTDVCAACGTALLGQQPAAVQNQTAQPPTQQSTKQPYTDQVAPVQQLSPNMSGIDPSVAQAEIDQYMSQTRAKKRTKATINICLLLIVIGAIAFYFVRSAQKKAQRQELYQFYIDYIKIDEEPVAEFWRCVVRAKHRDIHKSPDNLAITDGLEKAFSLFPKGQPDLLKDKCIPLIDEAIDQFVKMKKPEGFGPFLKDLTTSLDKIKETFKAYIGKLEQRKELAANEKEVLDTITAFHTPDKSLENKAIGYVNLLMCVVPDVAKMAKNVKKSPDVQELIEFIFNTCKKDLSFADTIRKTCFDKIKDTNKPKDYHIIINQMSGDDRDASAIEDCFKRANKGFFGNELDAVGKSFVESRNSFKKVLVELEKYKKDS